MSTLAANLASELRELYSYNVSSKIDLDLWYQKSNLFQKRLHSIYAHLYDSLPHEIEHYLADADIRFKDPEYALSQNNLIQNIISDLESRSSNLTK